MHNENEPQLTRGTLLALTTSAGWALTPSSGCWSLPLQYRLKHAECRKAASELRLISMKEQSTSLGLWWQSEAHQSGLTALHIC